MAKAIHGGPDLSPGQKVVLTAFDDIPEHTFEISEVFDDCVGGYSLSGPLAGEYGEPDFSMILRVIQD